MKILSLDEKPVLNLDLMHFQHLSGNILIIGTWYLHPVKRRAEPCLVFLDAARKVARKRTIPCVILQDDMWRWTLEEGDPLYMAAQIKDWLKSGALPGSYHNKADVFRVLDAVQARLRDLWSMPPLPVKAAVQHGAIPGNVVGELIVTERDTGKTVQAIEVTSSHVRN